jgi:hypothetical protein
MDLVEMAVAEFGFFETGDKFLELQKKVREKLPNWGACRDLQPCTRRTGGSRCR